MKKTPRSIITSRAAKKDFDDIKMKHSLLLKKMQAHQEKVGQYKLMKAQEAQNNKSQEVQKHQADQDFQMKNREYDLKLLEALK